MGEGREGADMIGDDRVGQDKGWKSSGGRLELSCREKGLEGKSGSESWVSWPGNWVERSARLGVCLRELSGFERRFG